jgi:Xaa-Pro aminopeptidase
MTVFLLPLCRHSQLHGSFLARTYLVNPTKGQKAAYSAVLDIQQDVIDNLKVGAKVWL